MENNKEGNKEEPLLYIHQPKFQKPERKMQDSYLSEDLTENVEMERTVPQEERKMQTFTLPPLDAEQRIEVVQDIPEEKEEEVVKKPVSAADYFRRNAAATSRKSWNLKPVKPFSDMSIPEKLQYLSGFPSSKQPYPCEFITEKQRYRGTLSKFENDQILLKTLQGGMEEVDVKDLQGIKIIL